MIVVYVHLLSSNVLLGVPFHKHGAVFNEVIYGFKRWFLYLAFSCLVSFLLPSLASSFFSLFDLFLSILDTLQPTSLTSMAHKQPCTGSGPPTPLPPLTPPCSKNAPLVLMRSYMFLMSGGMLHSMLARL